MADTTNTTTVHTVEVVRYDDPTIITERVAVAAFIAGYTNPTRQSYGTDLRISAGATTTASTCSRSSDWQSKQGSTSASRHTVCATRSSPQRSTPASQSEMSKRPPATRIRERQCATTRRAAASTDTPPTSCPPSSPEQPDRPDALPNVTGDVGQRAARNAPNVRWSHTAQTSLATRSPTVFD